MCLACLNVQGLDLGCVYFRCLLLWADLTGSLVSKLNFDLLTCRTVLRVYSKEVIEKRNKRDRHTRRGTSSVSTV
jgi:hypothetical protein